jgi:hypothetical protein
MEDNNQLSDFSTLLLGSGKKEFPVGDQNENKILNFFKS